MSDTTHTDRQLFKQDVSYYIVAIELQNIMWCVKLEVNSFFIINMYQALRSELREDVRIKL